MSETIQDLYTSFSEQMEPIQEDSRYFRYLFEMAQASGTTIEQQREELVKVVDEEWISMIEDSLDAINTIIEKPRRFITTEEEVVPVSLAKKISADSVRHLSQNTQFLAPSDDGGVHPTRILNVNTVETYDLYENRFIYHLIQHLLTFVDKRTDVIFWSTGNEIRNRFKMHSKIDDAYEEIEYNVEMTIKNRQSFAENDADNMDVFMRIDRVRRLVMALRGASFCQIMNGCSAVRSPIQRTNLIMKDPNYRKCYQLWQFMERYDKVGYNIDVQQQALAFDDEYMVQMYTNLINNYAVFKSLTDDERNLQELESVQHAPVAPKFIKEIKEEQVDSPDLPDVEVRRVFVEEVTQAQLDAEQALAEAREQIEELQGQLKSWKVQAHALTDERDDLALVDIQRDAVVGLDKAAALQGEILLQVADAKQNLLVIILHVCPPSSRRSSEPAGCRRRGSVPAPPPDSAQSRTCSAGRICSPWADPAGAEPRRGSLQAVRRWGYPDAGWRASGPRYRDGNTRSCGRSSRRVRIRRPGRST